MRSALLCVFFTLIATHEHRCQSTEDDNFSPTPIPLNSWHDRRKDGAETLQGIANSDAPTSTVAVPAHYWEDALRHSVYLTLVRDKIDQLIGKSTVLSPNKSENKSSDFDDHDLWEKIKTAPFDRRKSESSEWLGDVTMMAKGRLLEENGTFRFAEDEKTQKCDDEKCKEGVKAYWFVKRVRQRDNEATTGKYHYELTFSVTSHTSLKKKPYDNPVRTFTVRETVPTEAKRVNEPTNNRPQRAVWVHRNIAPSQYHKNVHNNQGLDRIFSSLFSDDDSYDDPSPRYRQQQSHFSPQNYPQHSKPGYSSHSDQHHQKKMMPYPYKPPSHKYSRPSYQAPPYSNIPPYREFDSNQPPNNAYPPTSSDHRYLPSNMVKTTRPAVLPTPVLPPLLPTIPPLKNGTFDMKFNLSDVVTKEPEPLRSYKGHGKPKPAPMRVNYFPDHVRPPVYNAPPGVFVTMDKKPFKPMPPLKLIHSSKSPKPRPIDFRPSPQLDIQYSNTLISPDTSFRPINFDYSDSPVTTETSVVKKENKTRRIIPSVKKPLKKQSKEQPSTTTFPPDIITVRDDSIEDTDTMDWANVIGAFSKTTPMATQKDKASTTESTPSITTSAPTTTTEIKKVDNVRRSTTTTTTTTTTEKPKKRTRPPHKFTKTDKNKKRKPVSTITRSTTNAPEKISRTRTTQDLTAQASSSTTNEKPSWKPKDKPASTTPMTTTTSTSSTTAASTTSTTEQTTTVQSTTVTQTTMPKPSTTLSATSSIYNEVVPLSTTQPKDKNRYRQSTLMYKGTSVKHDKWNTISTEKNNKTVASNKFPRRKVSNFQGYSTLSTIKSNDEEIKENREDHSTSTTTTTTEMTTQKEIEVNQPTEATYDYSEEQFDNINDSTTDPSEIDESEEESEDEPQISESSEEQESKDHNEYIFSSTSSPNEDINEVIAADIITVEKTLPVTTTPFPTPKNKTKCKKKKNQVTSTTETPFEDMKLKVLVSTTEKTTTVDFLDELLSSFDEPKNETSRHTPSHETDTQDDSKDIEEFLSSFESKNRNSEEDIAYDVEISEEFSPFNNEDENRASRNANENYSEYPDRYSILELMAME